MILDNLTSRALLRTPNQAPAWDRVMVAAALRDCLRQATTSMGDTIWMLPHPSCYWLGDICRTALRAMLVRSKLKFCEKNTQGWLRPPFVVFVIFSPIACGRSALRLCKCSHLLARWCPFRSPRIQSDLTADDRVSHRSESRQGCFCQL